MAQLQAGEPLELRGQLRGLFGRQVQRERLHGEQAPPVRFARAEDGPKDAGPDLVQDFERSERRWRSVRRSWRQVLTLVRGRC